MKRVERSKLVLTVAAALLLVLGLVRYVTGVELFRAGIVARDSGLQGAAVGLVVVGLVLLAAGVCALLRNRIAWSLGVGGLVAFLVGGFVSGYVVFGPARAANIVVSVLVAGVAVLLLTRGRPALRVGR